MPFLLSVLLGLGLTLPSFALAAPQHAQRAVPAGMSVMAMGHGQATLAQDGSARKPGHACRMSCPLCAMTCCGVILPVIAPIPRNASRPYTVFAAEPQLGIGVPIPLDPYPPKRTSQG